MRNLTIVIANAWFWLVFISVGPMTSTSQFIVGGATLLGGCSLFALWGALAVWRRRVRAGSTQTVLAAPVAEVGSRSARCASSIRRATSSD